jgi:hypothetical protein
VENGLGTGIEIIVKTAMQEIAAHLDITEDVSNEFLSLEMRRGPGRLWLGQTSYIEELLERSGMQNAKAVSTPMAAGQIFVKEGKPVPEETPYAVLVDTLNYVATMTRSDIAQAVGMLCRYMAAPTEEPWQGAKRDLCYLAGTKDLGLLYTKGGSDVMAYGDTDHAADPDSRKSRSGSMIVKNSGAILWKSKLQSTVAQLTCEAECTSKALAVQQALWVHQILADLSGSVECVPVFCDNQLALQVLLLHTAGMGGCKHIDIVYHFVRDCVVCQEVKLASVHTGKQLAVMFTKALSAPKLALSAPKLEEMCAAIGVLEF